MSLVPDNSLTLSWRVGVLLLSVAAVIPMGALYGVVAIYDANYLGHFFVGALCALLLYAILQSPPDSDPDLCFLIALLATVLIWISGTWVAVDFIRDDFPGQTTLQAIRAHAAEGVWFETREYGRSGRWIDELRQGPWVYVAWVLQFITLPIILFIGAITGGFRAHTKQVPEQVYETALDLVAERNDEAANPFNWEPLNQNVRGLHLGQLLIDLRHNYGHFIVPLIILGSMALIFPAHESKPLFVFWASLFMLGAANATLTGEHRAKLRLGAAFDQFFLYARFVGMLVLAFIVGFLFTLMPMGFLLMAGIEFENMFLIIYTTIVVGLMLVVLTRLWPMLVMHYLFDDIDMEANTGQGMSARILNNSFWHGAPGPSLALAWQFTGSLEAFTKATLPALTLPVILVGLHFELYVRSDGVWRFLLDVLFYAGIVPFAYLILMDRGLALREWFLDDPDALPPEITPAPGTVGEIRRWRVDDDMQDFLEEVPRGLVDTDSVPSYGQRHQEKAALEEAGDDPDKLLAAAISQLRDDWFDIAVENGADPNGGVTEGATPRFRRHLNRAISRPSIDFVDKLVAAGADLHSTAGGPAVMSTVSGPAREDRLAMLEHVLALGADVNARGHEGRTALMDAAEHGSPEAIEILLAHGANWRVQSDNGWDAVRCALKRDRPRALRLLLKEARRHSDFDINDPELYRVGRFAQDCAAVLIKAGMDPDIDLGAGDRPLHWAAGDGNSRKVKMLLDQGADPHLRNEHGVTALDIAEYGDPDGRNRGAYDACVRVLQRAMAS